MSAMKIPAAHRAVLSDVLSSFKAPASLAEQVFDHAARKLYPRLVVYEALAHFKSDPERRNPSDNEIVEARRNFLDSFAYLCDVEKGGATVTAVGLEELTHSNCLWLAANEGVRKDIRIYAENMLSHLKSLTPDTESSVEQTIFHLAVGNCESRISTYKEEVRKHARNCRMQLRHKARTEIAVQMQGLLTRGHQVRLIRKRLKTLSEPLPTMTNAEIVDYCYDMRKQEVSTIKSWSQDANDDFSRLAHFIGRIGATRSAAHDVVKGMIMVPALSQIGFVRAVNAPPVIRKEMIGHGDLSPYEIVRSICEDRAYQNPLQSRTALRSLVELDLPSGTNSIRASLEKRRKIITRVHAELQIADNFSRDHRIFVGDDKYIGCSKPACYFCFTWLSSHKHGYVLPASHYKIVLGCRGPDNNINESGAVILKEMYSKLTNRLGQDILDFLLKMEPGDGQHRNHYQSTDGSSYAQSRVATASFR